MLQNVGFGTIPWEGGGGVVANREPGSYIFTVSLITVKFSLLVYICSFAFGYYYWFAVFVEGDYYECWDRSGVFFVQAWNGYSKEGTTWKRTELCP